MNRNREELAAEAVRNGLTVRDHASNEHLELLLRDFYWAKNHPGEKMLAQVEPMLAQKLKDLEDEEQDKIWNSPQWVAQLKLNGCRLLMHIHGVKNRFTTRGKSVSDFLYGEVTDNLPFHRDLALPELDGTVLDGEIISPYAVVDTGSVVTVKALQAAMAVINSDPKVGAAIQEKYGPMEYHVFDIVMFQGNDVSTKPYEQRLELLRAVQNILNKVEGSNRLIKSVPIVKDNKEAYFKEVIAEGEEGVMLKDLRASYGIGKRSPYILKVKRFEELDAFVVGFTPGKEGKKLEDMVGGLLFAVHDSVTGNPTIIGCISAMKLEFRRNATVPSDPLSVPSDKELVYTGQGLVKKRAGTRTIAYQLNPELLGKVAVIQGQDFSGRKFRFEHCRFAKEYTYTQGGKFVPWRKDKSPADCREDIGVIAKRIGGTVEA